MTVFDLKSVRHIKNKSLELFGEQFTERQSILYVVELARTIDAPISLELRQDAEFYNIDTEDLR